MSASTSSSRCWARRLTRKKIFINFLNWRCEISRKNIRFTAIRRSGITHVTAGNAHTHTHTLTHSHTHTHIHMNTHTHTHVHMNTHIWTRTHTHTYEHAHISSSYVVKIQLFVHFHSNFSTTLLEVAPLVKSFLKFETCLAYMVNAAENEKSDVRSFVPRSCGVV